MQAVTMYKAKDGTIFASADEAEQRDKTLRAVAKLEKLLRPVPKDDGCTFANGGGYVRQDPIMVQEFKRQILLLGARHHSKFEEWAKNPIAVHPSSVVARVLSECDPALYKAWHRVTCMDEQYREWGQPYFALHPEEGKQHEAM